MTGTELIAQERQRQIEVEGWSAEHDDGHGSGEMAMAAACYAADRLIYTQHKYANQIVYTDPWPWDDRFDKRPCDGNVIIPNNTLPTKKRIHQLAKAGALIAAEIDRLQRQGGAK